MAYWDKSFRFDSHLHFRQVLEKPDGGHEWFGASGDAPGNRPQHFGVSSCHDPDDLAAVWDSRNPRLAPSFGIHPQWPVETHAQLLGELATAKKIVAVGECGFDFWGGGVAEAEAVQRPLFEYQLDLARAFSLPLIVHLRRGTHMVFRYRRELAALPAVVFHSWPGPLGEARSLLKGGVNGWFSLGTPLLWNARKAHETLRGLGLGRVFLETDAPWQPIRGQDHSWPAQIDDIARRALDLMDPGSLPCSHREEITTSPGHVLAQDHLWEILYQNWEEVFANHWPGVALEPG